MPLISPAHEDKTEHVKLLLGLAEDVNDVQTTMDGPTGLAFVVPEYLHKLYLKALRLQAGEEEGTEEVSDSEPAKRKPGRPKGSKNTDSKES